MEYKIELNNQEVQIILQGLGELPLKISAQVFGKIQQQVISQEQTAKQVPLDTDLEITNEL